MLSFALYLIGSMVCIAGLACVATLLGAAPMYVTAVAGGLFVLSIIVAAVQRRVPEPPTA